LHLFLTASLAAAIAAVATRAAIPWLQRQGAVATENARTMHRGSVPKGGGLAVLAAIVLALGLSGTEQLADPYVEAMLLGTLVLAVLSWRNDLRHVSATIRLPIHLTVALVTVLALPTDALIFQGWLPFTLDRALAALALAWMINLYNFMDGINGIAGVETATIGLGYIAAGAATGTVPEYASLAAALAGASIGFLIWNMREKALVFLGDAGSVPLGYLGGALMIDLAAHGAWAAALIVPMYFLVDATWTLFRRLARGERIWEAHRSHAYQRAARALGGHLPVVRRIVIANAVLLVLAGLAARHPFAALGLAACVAAALMLNLTSAAKSRSLDSDPSRP
jgi:UDP-N-acetylmuramyl pentapeptide phosphotransferase/UDP-N-acetylglucosamine-1-phosphate transferase